MVQYDKRAVKQALHGIRNSLQIVLYVAEVLADSDKQNLTEFNSCRETFTKEVKNITSFLDTIETLCSKQS